MSTGTESLTDIVGGLTELLEHGAAALVSGTRLAGPAAPQDSAEELVPDLSSGCVGVGLAYEDDVVAAIAVTKTLATELGGGTTGDALQQGLQGVLQQLVGGRTAAVTQVVELENEQDLIAFLGGRPGLVGAGIFDGDDVVATLGAAGSAAAAPTTVIPTPQPAAQPVQQAPVADAAPIAAVVPEPSAPVAAPIADPFPVAGDDKLARGLALLADVHLEVTAELGRTKLRVSELLSLEPGAVIGLEREAGSPVDLLVNGTLFARAEVIVVEQQYAVRITELVGGGVPQ